MFLQIFLGEKPDVKLKPGEIVFNEGDLADKAFVVASGVVKLSIGGKEIPPIEKSDIFGEMALLDDKTRSATATAGDEGAKLHSLDKVLFLEAVKADPEFAIELMKALVARIRTWGKMAK